MTRPVEFAQILLACLKEQLDAGPNPIAEQYVCLRFGEIVNPMLGTQTDECCTGLAWVRISDVTSLADPDSTESGNCVDPSRRLTLEMGTARCIPWGSVQYPTDCDAWTAAALKMDADHEAMENAICCLTSTLMGTMFEPRIVPGEYQPFGPDGNCIRGTLTVTLDYSCGCSSGS